MCRGMRTSSSFTYLVSVDKMDSRNTLHLHPAFRELRNGRFLNVRRACWIKKVWLVTKAYRSFRLRSSRTLRLMGNPQL